MYIHYVSPKSCQCPRKPQELTLNNYSCWHHLGEGFFKLVRDITKIIHQTWEFSYDICSSFTDMWKRCICMVRISGHVKTLKRDHIKEQLSHCQLCEDTFHFLIIWISISCFLLLVKLSWNDNTSSWYLILHFSETRRSQVGSLGSSRSSIYTPICTMRLLLYYLLLQSCLSTYSIELQSYQ